MRQLAIKAAVEAAFLAAHPFWTVERRAQDPFGVVWLSFRIDVQAERAAARPLEIANRALARAYPGLRATSETPWLCLIIRLLPKY